MSQKICIISFDHWDYDKHIVTALQKKGFNSFHIKIGGFKHKNIWSRLSNTLNKIFLGKNPKLKKRQDYIIDMLTKNGIQDQILVINPELIDKDYHLKIKLFTKKYIAYLYDSMDRCPINHLLDNIFDEIYSFDKNDIVKYGFKETTNYNYIEILNSDKKKIKNDLLYIASFDNRLNKIIQIKNILKSLNIPFRFIIIGKKTLVYKIKNLLSDNIKELELSRKRINQDQLQNLYLESKAILDIVRDNQSGLSFRIFEAMAFERKIITNNVNILNYDFYNPNNILLIKSDDFNEITKSFFETEYESLPQEIYNEYTITNWISKIFELKIEQPNA